MRFLRPRKGGVPLSNNIVDEDVYHARFVESLRDADIRSPRSQQAESGVIGPSDLVCRERVRRMITRSPRTDVPSNIPAALGTYIHRGIREARRDVPVLQEIGVRIPLPNGLVLTGSADEVDPVENSVTDFKTVSDLAYRKRVGSDPTHWRQVHLYAHGLVDMKVLTDLPLVRLVYMDRSGDGVWVVQQTFNPIILKDAVEFLDDVLYAITYEEEASRDWPAPMCRRFCPFYSGCRPEWTGGEPLHNPAVLEAVEVYKEQTRITRAAEKIKAQAREKLRGVEGRTPDGTHVRWTVVNTDDRSYERLDVTDGREL